MARRPNRANLVENTHGSESAKQRLRSMLDTLSGERTVESVCEELGINGARFYKLRNRFLQESVEGLEPRTPGVKPKYPHEVQEEVEELNQRIEELEAELNRSRVREEIALVTTRSGDGGPQKGSSRWPIR